MKHFHQNAVVRDGAEVMFDHRILFGDEVTECLIVKPHLGHIREYLTSLLLRVQNFFRYEMEQSSFQLRRTQIRSGLSKMKMV